MTNQKYIRSRCQKYSEEKSGWFKENSYFYRALYMYKVQLGFMKQFVKVLPKEDECFKYLLWPQFPSLSDIKLKEGVFVRQNIRKMMNNDDFETKMKTIMNVKAWKSFKLVVASFLGNKKGSKLQIYCSFGGNKISPWDRYGDIIAVSSIV